MAGFGSLREVLFAPVLTADALDELVDVYSVKADERYAGVLDAWERDESGRPVALIVARGWFGRERFKVPFEKLVEVDHDRHRLTVDSDAVPPSPRGVLDRLVEALRSRTGGGVKPRSGTLLCALDDDADTESVLGVARELATALEVPLVLARPDQLVAELVSRPGAPVVRRALEKPSSATSLAELAARERARLVVVGRPREAASTPRDLPCPVVVVPPQLRRAS